MLSQGCDSVYYQLIRAVVMECVQVQVCPVPSHVLFNRSLTGGAVATLAPSDLMSLGCQQSDCIVCMP
jgi:hypothetical protein